MIKTPISPKDNPGLLTVQKKKRSNPSKPVRVTWIYGRSKCSLKSFTCSRREERKGREKKKGGHEKEQLLETFFRCKDSCVCIKQNGKCDLFGLCYFSECKSGLRSDCTKMPSKMAGRVIIFPSCNKNSDR